MKLHIPKTYPLVAILILALLHPSSRALADATEPKNNDGARAAVEVLFADTPAMIAVARCESTFQQYTKKGATFTGAGGRYIGVFQIAKSHTSAALALGFDIKILEGNLGYAKYMYQHEGLKPWKGCVKNTANQSAISLSNSTSDVTADPPAPTVNIAKQDTEATPAATIVKNVEHLTAPPVTTQIKPLLTQNMGIGATGREVVNLQKILNDSGFYIAHSGDGSPGQETDTFGVKTQDALKRFQCTHDIACNGNPDTTGYGYVGPTTRLALIQAAKKQAL